MLASPRGQQRCSRVVGKTSRSAVQNPKAPSIARQNSVTDKPPAAALVQTMRVACNERGHLSLHRRCQKIACALTLHIRKRIRSKF